MSDIAVKVENVSKNFLLPHEKVSSIKSIFTNLFRYIGSKRSYETQHALNDVSLEIKKGEFFGIVGRNGSGKSTLLKMLAGIYQPTSGKITVEGRLVPFIELGVGFSPELTGRQNVYLNGALLGFSEKEIDDQYNDIVEFAELEKFMDQKLKNYSSGMQVRLAFSMAVRAKADVLLIDEVLAVGDADFQRKCFAYFKKLKKSHTTVVFVTHDMEAVREYCDRAMLIEKNEIRKIGNTNEVAQEYLKLFTQSSIEGSTDAPGENRWGDQEVSIKKLHVKTDEEFIYISETIQANKDVEGFISGIRIRSTSGQHITGSNTKIEHLPLHALKAGETVDLVWKMPNYLSDGDYFIDPAVLRIDAITVHDWWDEAIKFSVKKIRKIPYVTDPGFKVEYK